MSVGAFAQGTVAFNNFQVTPRIYTNDLAGHSGLITQKTFTVALYWASASGQFLSPIFTAQANSAADGMFFFSGVTTPNATAPGASAVFQVYAWTGSASSYSSALASGGIVGSSSVFLNGTGGGGTPPGPATPLTSWTGDLILARLGPPPPLTPEPTTMALGGLGAAALFLFRRRK